MSKDKETRIFNGVDIERLLDIYGSNLDAMPRDSAKVVHKAIESDVKFRTLYEQAQMLDLVLALDGKSGEVLNQEQDEMNALKERIIQATEPIVQDRDEQQGQPKSSEGLVLPHYAMLAASLMMGIFIGFQGMADGWLDGVVDNQTTAQTEVLYLPEDEGLFEDQNGFELDG